VNHAAALADFHAAMQRLEPEPEHTRHVAHLAVRLFDETIGLHGLGPDERVLLEGAACLHDIGWPVSKRGLQHHKHSARLIRAQTWPQLSPLEVEITAMVARYHRRALPCAEHEDFQRLPRARRETVRRLAALMRLADALDRSHLQQVRDLSVRLGERHLEVTLVSRVPPEREIAAALKKGDLATEVFAQELAFRFQPIPPRRTSLPGGWG
jgi:exopolyphosphatase/guanosine-5'-triphosphate,3'-diphosphate pyrophosphatase